MPHASAAAPLKAMNTNSKLSVQIPEPNVNGASSNGALSPNSNGALSPPIILDPTPKKPPKPPAGLGRTVLPVKKSKTLPINFEETVPSKVSTGLLNGKKLFVTKPLKEVVTIPQSTSENGKYLTTRSPSPSYKRSMSLSVETGSIAELAKRHVPNNNLLVSRSPSPSSYGSVRSSASQYSTCSSNGTFVPLSRSSSMNSSTLYNRSPTPRRLYPQTSDSSDAVNLQELRSKEQAPVVFDANLSFVLGCNRQPVRQKFKPIAAHLEEGTSSNYLSNKIDNFLKRTDHVMEEWKRLGHKDDLDVYCNGKRKIGRSKSATNIMIKGFTLFSRTGSRASSVCRSSRGISEDRTTVSEMDEVNHKYKIFISRNRIL